MTKNDKPDLPAEALKALRAYIEQALARIDSLPGTEQLTLRSAITLYDRLELCIQAEMAISAAMFSPADLWALDDVASASPDSRADLAELGRAIERAVKRRP